MRSSNPALRANTFRDLSVGNSSGEVMSIQGTVNKTFILLFLTLLSASWVWSNPQNMKFVFPAAIIGFIVAIVTAFKKELSPYTSPAYALIEGVFLGGISLVFERSYPGIVTRAVGLTFGVLFSLLLAYKSGAIKVTNNFRLGVVAATGGIAVFYLVSWVLRMFGIQIPFISQATPIGIAFSVFVVIIAALNLVLNFDLIERGSKMNVPRYMEWYGAFSLMVTLIWLYIEILILLSKLNRR